jgi:hypothetical protein
MAEKDHSRDNSWRGFVGAVKNMLYHFDLEVQRAAQRVMDVFNHYGDVAKRGYDEETAAIDDIMREFEKPDLAADLQTLHAATWRDRLKTDNDDFKTVSRQRIEETAAKPTVRMKEARVATDEKYRNVVLHLEYMTRAGKTSQELTELIAELNSYVKHYKTVMARKQGSKPKEEV